MIIDTAKALNDHVDAARTNTFKWGKHDCATWVGQYVQLVTGIDAVAKFDGQYDSAVGAAKAIIKLEGCRDLVAVFDKYLKRSCVPYAMRGDVCYHKESGAVGLCVGNKAAFLSPDGLAFMPMSDIDYVWEVRQCLQS